MKEMTIEEKAKAYDEALERARNIRFGNPQSGTANTVCEEIFPELKEESEDERIREQIVYAINKLNVPGSEKNKLLAWLEKQGESDETKAKTILINKGYPIDANGTFPTYEEMYDIIKEGLEKQGEQKPTIEMKSAEESLGIDSDTYNKIVDECIYGEQKPADKVEPKFKVGQTIKKEGFNSGFPIVKIENGFYYNDMGDNFPFTDQDSWELVEQKPAWSGEDNLQLQAAIDICKSSGHTITSDWLKSIKDKIQPKQEWSEEDEDMIQALNACIDVAIKSGMNYISFDSKNILIGKVKDWLKSLKERVQPKQELSEEDKRILSGLSGLVNDCYLNGGYALPTDEYDEYKKWLKPLRPQTTWKPSEEQMEALRKAEATIGVNHVVLAGLISDLEKLKG